MSFDQFNNPWAVGGEMHRRLPWVQESMEHGWGVGNDYFQPKTKEEIRKEALLQLAVLAVAVAAPAVLGAVGGAGAAGAGAAGGGGAGLGASAQAATGAITQGSVAGGLSGLANAGVSAGAGSVAGAAASSAGAAAASSALGISLGAGAAAYAALQPFLNPQNVQAIQAAAGVGVDALGNLLQNQPPNGRPSFVYEPGTQDDHVEDFPFAHPTGNRPSREPARLLTAIVDRLDGIAGFRQLGERIAREKEGEKSPLTMQRLSRDARVRGMLAELAVEAVRELGSGNPWEEGHNWLDKNHKSRNETTEFTIRLNLLLYTKWNSRLDDLLPHHVIAPDTFVEGDLAEINQEFQKIFTPGYVTISNSGANSLGIETTDSQIYKMNLEVQLLNGGDLSSWDEDRGDFARVVLGSKDERWRIEAWANPKEPSDVENSNKVRALAAFIGERYGRHAPNMLYLNPFIFSPTNPYVTRKGPDGELVWSNNIFQEQYSNGIIINDASDTSVLSHELSHFMYRTPEKSLVTAGHGKGGINNFERSQIELTPQNRQDFIDTYLKRRYNVNNE